MTTYTLHITTYKIGCNIKFEFKSKEVRESFLSMFINNLSNEDHVINICFGEISKMKG